MSICVYEPVGRLSSSRSGLRADAVVLVADFGAGTSDFSVVRFVRRGAGSRRGRSATPASASPADTFDYRIIEESSRARLGKDGQYKSFGKILAMPQSYFANFARWNQLAMMKTSGELDELGKLARLALDPEPLHRFIAIVENDLGLLLYRAVSRRQGGIVGGGSGPSSVPARPASISARRSAERVRSLDRPDVDCLAATVDEPWPMPASPPPGSTRCS